MIPVGVLSPAASIVTALFASLAGGLEADTTVSGVEDHEPCEDPIDVDCAHFHGAAEIECLVYVNLGPNHFDDCTHLP